MEIRSMCGLSQARNRKNVSELLIPPLLARKGGSFNHSFFGTRGVYHLFSCAVNASPTGLFPLIYTPLNTFSITVEYLLMSQRTAHTVKTPHPFQQFAPVYRELSKELFAAIKRTI
jgi:hypothetical protein